MSSHQTMSCSDRWPLTDGSRTSLPTPSGTVPAPAISFQSPSDLAVLRETSSVAAQTDSRRADIDVVDNATALFRFRSDATGVLELSWTSPANHMSFEILGSEGILSAGAPGEGIQIRQRDGETVTIAPTDFNPPGPNSFQCFADAIAGVAPTPVPGETGHAIQLVLDAILASGEQGGAPVTIAEA